MKAGRLNNRVTIQQPGSTQDAYGHATQEAWTEVATVWAEVKPITGRERWASEHTANISSMAIELRFRRDITPAMRVKHGAEYYEIKGPPINVDNRDRALILICERVAV